MFGEGQDFHGFGVEIYKDNQFQTNVEKVKNDQNLTLIQFLNGENIQGLISRIKGTSNFTPYILFWTFENQLLGLPLIKFFEWFSSNPSKNLFSETHISNLQIVSGNYLFQNSARMANVEDLIFLQNYLTKPETKGLRNSLDRIITAIDHHNDLETRDQLEEKAIQLATRAISKYFQTWRGPSS